jgi:hypothetical protein
MIRSKLNAIARLNVIARLAEKSQIAAKSVRAGLVSYIAIVLVATLAACFIGDFVGHVAPKATDIDQPVVETPHTA